MPKIFNSFQLKLIAITIMLIDHTGAVIFPDIIFFRIVGRIAFPLFAFFIVEGFRHTSSLGRYLTRLAVCAVLFQLPDWITESDYMLEIFKSWGWHSVPDIEYVLNIFATLFLGLLAVTLFEKFKKINIVFSWLAAAGIAVIAEVIGADYGIYGVFYIVMFYLAGEGINKIAAGAVILHIAYVFYKMADFFISAGSFPNLIQLYSLFAIGLIALYNREQGRKMKYFFYLFYPVHMIILYIIDWMLI